MLYERNRAIDIAKGLGILFVVWGHHFDHALYAYIYSFHMPLFFFLSGLTFNPDRYSTWKVYIRQKARRLLVPYFIFAAILFLFWFLVVYSSGSTSVEGASVFKNLVGIAYSQGQLEYMAWGVEIWFLTCLFVVCILAYAVFCIRKPVIRWILIIAAAFFGYGISRLSGFHLPWSIDVALIGLLFFAFGFSVKKFRIRQIPVLFRILVLSALLLINILFFLLNVRVDLYQKIFGNPVFFLFSAIGGIGFYYLLSMIIKENRLLEFVGRNSLYVLAFHMRAWTVINQLIVKRVSFIKIEGIPMTLLVSVVQIAIVLTGVWIARLVWGRVFGHRKEIVSPGKRAE